MANEKRNLRELSAVEAVALNFSLTEITGECIKNTFELAKLANVKEYDLLDLLAYTINHAKDDSVFWEKVAPGIEEELDGRE